MITDDILYTNSADVLSLIKEISMKVDFSGLYDLILRIPNQYLQFFDSKRLYKQGELFHVGGVKYLVLKDVTVQNVDVLTLEYYQPIQTKLLRDWVYGEYIQKGFQRKSPTDGQIYESQQFIKQSTTDPALVTLGQWTLVESQA